jgi:hypothetical protein
MTSQIKTVKISPMFGASTLMTRRFSMSDEEGGDGNDDAATGGAAVAAAGAGDGALGPSAGGLERPALVRWRRPLLRGPRPAKCAVHGNKYACLLNAVPMRARRQFGQHNLIQTKHRMRYRMRYSIRCRAGNIR